MPEEPSEFIGQLRQQTQATLVIYHRLCKNSPAFSERAKQSDFDRHWDSHDEASSGLASVSLS